MPQVLSTIRGGALTMFIGVLLLALAIVLDLVAAGSTGVFYAGAASAIVVGLIPKGSRGWSVVGAAMTGGVAAGVGVTSGFGALEGSVCLGAVLAVVWILGGEPARGLDRGIVWMWVAVGLTLAVVIPLLVDGGALGHDESAYALKARQWLEGTPGSGWSSHRGTGMSVYGYLVLALGGSESGLRLIGLAGGIALVTGVWALGRRMSSAVAGAIAALGIIAGPALLFRTTEYLSDVPAAALLVWCMVVVWHELEEREIQSFGLVWAAPLALGAFYLRYQSALSLALIALISMFLWWPKLRRRPEPVYAMLGVALLGLIPHFRFAVDLYGNPLGIVLFTSERGGRAYVGEGLADYRDQFGWALAGWVGPIASVSAFGGLLLGFRQRATRVKFLFLLVPAVVQIMALGLISHGEPRFLFFPIALVVVAGSIAIDRWLIRDARPWGRALALGLGAMMVGSMALSADQVRELVVARSASNEPVQLAAEMIEGDAAGGICGVLTSYAPQVTFYSGCVTSLFLEDLDPAAVLDSMSGESRFLLLIDDGKRQPAGSRLEGLIALTDGVPVRIEGDESGATVYRFGE